MKLTILGCHSASPHENKNSTAQLLETRSHSFLIDCGEGTQVQLRKAKVWLRPGSFFKVPPVSPPQNTVS